VCGNPVAGAYSSLLNSSADRNANDMMKNTTSTNTAIPKTIFIPAFMRNP
jgi:hypothetical protein